MRSIKFIKEPGYMYDLFFLFALYFNKDYCITNFSNRNHLGEDTEYFNKLLCTLPPIPSELMPFFYIVDGGKAFITSYYYDMYRESFLDGYNFDFVSQLLENQDDFIDKVISFFFKDFSEEEISECKKSINAVDKLLKRCKFSGDLKCSLYSFFISPAATIEKLSYELKSKELLLKQQYEKSEMLLSNFESEFNFEELATEFKDCQDQKANIDSFENIYVSVCLNHKNTMKIHFVQDSVVLILGNDYKEYIKLLTNESHAPDLDVFGTVISESNRVDILNLIHDKGEVTIKDIEQSLGFTSTNAYYHLSLMIKAGLIKTRNMGRTVLYSLNHKSFEALCDMLGKYSKEKTSDTQSSS